MKQYCHRIGMIVMFGTLFLLFPTLGWGACGEEARTYYGQGVQVNAKYVAAWKHCPEECLEEKRYFYTRALELCSSYTEAYINLGDVLEKLGRYLESRSHYTQAIDLCTRATELCIRSSGSAAQAMDQSSPSLLAIAYFGLGDLFFNTGEYARAVDAYDKGLQLHSNDKLAQELRGFALRLQDKAIPDAVTIRDTLGGMAFTTMGPAGVRPDRRLPLTIPFAPNDATFLPPAKRLLHELGTALQDILESTPSAAFLLEGHTDLRGPEPHNLLLSERRARRVAEHLVKVFHIPPDRLGIKGYGETRPRSLGSSEADHARNRRVVVVRLEVEELKADPSIKPVLDAFPKPPPLVVEVAVFQEDPESQPRKIREGAVLRAGDGYRIYFKPHQTCYIYLFQIDASGKLFRLYPYANPVDSRPPMRRELDGDMKKMGVDKVHLGKSNLTYGTADHVSQARTAYWVPGKNQWFELDTTRGEEVIYVVATKEHREDITDLMRRYTRASHVSSQHSIRQELDGGMKKMGVDKVYLGKPVEVTSRQGRTALLTTDQLSREGVSLVYRFAFRHE